jgi:polygalacturonase
MSSPASTLAFLITLFFVVLLGNSRAQRAGFNILDFGAKGDGKTVNTSAINQAIAACAKAGGGTVHVPAGEFRTGTVLLLSNVNLHLDSGAILKGSDDLGDYLKEGENRYGLILSR